MIVQLHHLILLDCSVDLRDLRLRLMNLDLQRHPHHHPRRYRRRYLLGFRHQHHRLRFPRHHIQPRPLNRRHYSLHPNLQVL